MTISGGTVSNDVIGGYSQNGDVIGNKVTVEGTATVKELITAMFMVATQ